MLNSRALARVQSAALLVIMIIAAVSGVTAYLFLRDSNSTSNTIKIGVCGDLDNTNGKKTWQGAVLAAEQVNAEGGVLGKQFEIVAEDSDVETPPFDIAVASNAMTKLITVDKADFILTATGTSSIVLQDICADYNKIMFSLSPDEELTQRVADNYDRYKGFFRTEISNISASILGSADSILTLRNYTGFNKVAFVAVDFSIFKQIATGVQSILLENGFEVVESETISVTTTDLTSVFAKVEASGAEILSVYTTNGASFVKEYYNRQSPFVVWGFLAGAGESSFWDLTEGKCEFVSFVGDPVIAGYPLTSKTLPTRDAFLERWGTLPIGNAANAYDLVRFILPDALKRAGSLENQAVIAALEATNVETSLARRSVFTSNHDVMIGAAGPNKPGEDYVLVCLFQWQNGVQVPVYPQELLKEAGVTYTYPDWAGPWSNK